MTSALYDLDQLDLSEMEFDIQCEFPRCTASAVVMSKGCADDHHAAICAGHLREMQARFEAIGAEKPTVCTHCHRPWLFFETHYDLVNI
ncbi:hypothetical protein FHT44_004933 [Mycolicibacterium sp. BK634]|uniref:hypothetical protein n=1 Tax=Mycolicibacterium sp. BK634 TaxID=2587099 RepID=UPI001620AB1B|nr:hypothetical protein [Mycolicibacterium sp. BK634]MBB3752421.1 hypothetical protein [Mycolicibacterium sp. BK634]